MKSDINQAIKEYQRARIDDQRSSQCLSDLTIAGFSSAVSYAIEKETQLAANYARLAHYLNKNPESLDRGMLEKIIGKEAVTEVPVKEKKTRKPVYISMKEAVSRLEEEEKNAGWSEKDLSNYQAYSQRIRWQIKQGRIDVQRTNGRIAKIKRKQFEKLVPYLIWVPKE